MVGKVAISMRSHHAELAPQGIGRAPHLHWTRLCHTTRRPSVFLIRSQCVLGSLEFGEVKAEGTAGKVWSGKVNKEIKAIKQIRQHAGCIDSMSIRQLTPRCGRCDELDQGTVDTVTLEVQVSWLLARDCPRNLIVR